MTYVRIARLCLALCLFCGAILQRPAQGADAAKCVLQKLRKKESVDFYEVVDPKDERFHVTADLIDGDLYLEIFLRDPKTGERSTQISGSQQFDEIIRHFRRSGNPVQRIIDEWNYGDNLARFNELTGPPHHMSLEEAAKRTWTGQAATRAGFARVRITARGQPGSYDEVFATFEK